MKNKALKIFLISSSIIIIFFCAFNIYIGYLFGNAAKETIKAVYEVKKEWRVKKINPIDSIVNQIEIKFDSLNKIKQVQLDTISHNKKL